MQSARKIIFILMTLACVSALAGCTGNAPSDSSPIESSADTSVAKSSSQEETVPTTDTSKPSSSTRSGASSSETTQSTSFAVTADSPAAQQDTQTKDETMPIMNIQIGNKTFTVTLYDNATTQALVEKLPLTLEMDDMNKNEKYYYFSDRLPTSSQQVGSIKTGDLMLYGYDCLVLFYESFSTSYSYTRLGYVEDTTGLTGALGSGSVQIAFSVGG